MKKHLAEELEIERENKMLRGACIYPGENRVDDYLKLCNRILNEIDHYQGLINVPGGMTWPEVVRMLRNLLQ